MSAALRWFCNACRVGTFARGYDTPSIAAATTASKKLSLCDQCGQRKQVMRCQGPKGEDDT